MTHHFQARLRIYIQISKHKGWLLFSCFLFICWWWAFFFFSILVSLFIFC